MRVNRLTSLTRFRSTRVTRRTTLAASAGGIAILSGLTRSRAHAQYGGSETQVGLGAPGANAFEFVGAIQQQGLDFSLAGYVTNLAGVDPALLFDGADPLERSEATARLALVGSATGVARSILQNLFVVNGEGSVQFVLIEPGASFETPDSFTSGPPVATAAVELQDVINVQAPQTGMATGFGALEIDTTEPFQLNGESLVIGEPGLRYRVTLTGQGQLHNPETLEATILVAGNGVVAR
jgi:hypothetical protein